MKRMLRHRIRILILTLLLAAQPLKAFASSATVPVQALFGVKIRGGAGVSYPQTGVLRPGEFARSTVSDGEWTIVRHNGGEGYVLSKYLREWADENLREGYVRATVDNDVLNGPSNYAKKIGVAQKDQVFLLLYESEDWYKVDFFGVPGCVSKLYMENLGSEAKPAQNPAQEQEEPSAGNAPEQEQPQIPSAENETLIPAEKGKYVEATEYTTVYSAPALDSSPLGNLYDGSIVVKRGTVGKWVSIEYNRRIGYVPASSVKDSSYTPDQIVTESGYDAAAKELIRLMNANRKAKGVGELEISQVLMDAAKIRAEEITVLYSHTRPDGSMCNSIAPDDIFGENIARGTGLPTPESAAKSFMSSEAHRVNAMDTRHTKTGAACVNVNGTLFWVQLFGK